MYVRTKMILGVFFCWKRIKTPTFAHSNYCSALCMVVALCCSERYTSCLSIIIYLYSKTSLQSNHFLTKVWGSYLLGVSPIVWHLLVLKDVGLISGLTGYASFRYHNSLEVRHTIYTSKQTVLKFQRPVQVARKTVKTSAVDLNWLID